MLKETNTPTRPRIEPGSPDPESDALTIRPVRPPRVTKYLGVNSKDKVPGDETHIYQEEGNMRQVKRKPAFSMLTRTSTALNLQSDQSR